MKAKLSFVLILCFLAISCMVGPGLNDWTYPLPNEYEMYHINSKTILITPLYKDKNPDSELIGIPAHIVSFCLNSRFVCAKTINTENEPRDDVAVSYYILDTLNQKVYGPFSSEQKYLSNVDALAITGLGEWIATSPAPEGAIFPQ